MKSPNQLQGVRASRRRSDGTSYVNVTGYFEILEADAVYRIASALDLSTSQFVHEAVVRFVTQIQAAANQVQAGTIDRKRVQSS